MTSLLVDPTLTDPTNPDSWGNPFPDYYFTEVVYGDGEIVATQPQEGSFALLANSAQLASPRTVTTKSLLTLTADAEVTAVPGTTLSWSMWGSNPFEGSYFQNDVRLVSGPVKVETILNPGSLSRIELGVYSPYGQPVPAGTQVKITNPSLQIVPYPVVPSYGPTDVKDAYSELANLLEAVVLDEFSDEQYMQVHHDRIHESLGSDGRLHVGISPSADRPGRAGTMSTVVLIQFYDAFDAEVDPFQHADPRIVTNKAERLRQALQRENTIGSEQNWFFQIGDTEYPPDATGNKTRFEMEILGTGNNSGLIETLA